MEQTNFPEGTCLVFIRHGNSHWNSQRNEAYASDALPPVRVAGSRDSNLTAQGRVESFLTGYTLKEIVNRYSKKGEIAFLGFSRTKRTRQTAQIAFNSADLRAGLIYPTDLLDERRHHTISETMGRISQSTARESANHDKKMRHDTLLHYISLNAMLEEGKQIQPCSGSVADALALDPLVWFDRYIKEAGAELMSNFLECFFDKYKRLAADDPSLPNDQLRMRSIAYALSCNLAIYAPSIADWACNEMQQPLSLRRKTPTGENMPDLSCRLEKYLRFLEGISKDLNEASVFVSITHSLSLLALRQLIEGFDDEHLNTILQSDGPPFPPNVAMVVYRSHGGRLVLQKGSRDPYHLAPELLPFKRRLYVTAHNVERICSVAEAVGAKPYIQPVKIGGDLVRVYGFGERYAALEQKTMPGLATCGRSLLKVKAVS
jgi:broad specificity phosphatase PhoE